MTWLRPDRLLFRGMPEDGGVVEPTAGKISEDWVDQLRRWDGLAGLQPGNWPE
jgi:hypothetical protein